MKFGRRCAQQSTGPSTANCERRSTVQRWILVAVLLAVQALSIGAVSYSFSLWVDPLAADFDVERKAILGLLGVFGIATCAASAIFGRFLDAGAPRTLLAIGVLALAAGLMLVAAAPTLWSVYLIFLLRSEEHTSELQSLMRISYAVFCLKKKNK